MRPLLGPGEKVNIGELLYLFEVIRLDYFLIIVKDPGGFITMRNVPI
jgi:hypothetical protein